MISESPNNNRRTKIIEARITEVHTRNFTAEVPLDASDSDDNLIYELAQIPTDSWEEPEDVQVTIEDSNDGPEYRMDMRDGKWHATQLCYETGSRRRLADRHSQIVKSLKESEELEFNRVTVEFQDERIVPGCIYYGQDYGVLVVFDEEHHRTGILRGFDRCFPSMTEAGPIPWDAVDELDDDGVDEFERTGTWASLERAAKCLAELDPKNREERQFLVPGSIITHPTPRKAVDAGELYLRFQPSSDAPDVTG